MSSRFDRRGLLRTAAILTAGTVQAAPAAGQVAENTDQARRCTIKVVQTFLLRHELQQPFGVSISVPLDKTRETLLVRIESNEGHIGWGETALGQRSTSWALHSSGKIHCSIGGSGDRSGEPTSATHWLSPGSTWL